MHYLNKAFVIVVVFEVVSLLTNIIDYGVEKISFKKDESSKAAYFALGKVFK
jgi:hypothetical protein